MLRVAPRLASGDTNKLFLVNGGTVPKSDDASTKPHQLPRPSQSRLKVIAEKDQPLLLHKPFSGAYGDVLSGTDDYGTLIASTELYKTRDRNRRLAQCSVVLTSR